MILIVIICRCVKILEAIHHKLFKKQVMKSSAINGEYTSKTCTYANMNYPQLDNELSVHRENNLPR